MDALFTFLAVWGLWGLGLTWDWRLAAHVENKSLSWWQDVVAVLAWIAVGISLFSMAPEAWAAFRAWLQGG